MTDIVERLRLASSKAKRNEMTIGEYWNLCDESADEIERLRRKRDEARFMCAAVVMNYDPNTLLGEYRQQAAEWLKERSALRQDAERGRYMIAHGCWHRGEEQTHLAVLVEQGSDLSCYATREAAIDKARAKEGK